MHDPKRVFIAGPVYLRPAAHAKLPSADMGPLDLHEYFSPLSAALEESMTAPQRIAESAPSQLQGMSKPGRHLNASTDSKPLILV